MVLEDCGQGKSPTQMAKGRPREPDRLNRGVGWPKMLQTLPREENRYKLWWANASQAESHWDTQLTQVLQTSLSPTESGECGRELTGPRGGPGQRGPLERMGPLRKRWVNYLHLLLIKWDHKII